MSYKEKAQDLYNMIGQGQLLEGFDKYYAENVVMTEPRGTREGKSSCRDYEVQFLNSVEAFHGQEIKSIAADEDKGVVFIEVAMDVTFKGGPRVNMEQVAVQQWEGDKIVHERFYYDNAQ
ncbi:nuclear transport factor 2 family protein [Porifericola rhodea]|uniref:nuclear transport factor 2 family protein n=1 Tax=Porifericola rhodea TaxID=930972 RepID=UPI002666A52E|nr:nuclear transport factor 2 family protein [Porifericola rhodea]WKN32495.1 nuclear transport factor 2 family protein [Porifericola rhodea]